MAKNTQMSNLAVNAEADALTALAAGGKLLILTGPQPATGDTAITTQNTLAILTLATPAFPPAVNGVLTTTSITGDLALAGGTAAWFRLFKADGVTPLWDGNAGISGANLILPSLTIVQGIMVNVAAFSHTISKSAVGF